MAGFEDVVFGHLQSFLIRDRKTVLHLYKVPDTLNVNLSISLRTLWIVLFGLVVWSA